ncbi:CAP domain-containing protein [Micromonospora sp. NPDC048830]|uniref:CAP domain-containing protein n=1 Tax=Micromonospora sp. NPDC048830 TaxID=3364257 RepID=UPI003714E4B3
MYGWTDGDDPENARWRQGPPADKPAWLTDRPAPRSAYLFGDEPDQPDDQRHHQSRRDPATGGQPVDLATYPVGGTGQVPTGGRGRHRSARRAPRRLLIGGAAAAATLLVSLGVGALALPGRDDPGTDAAAVDDLAAATPVVPGETAESADPLLGLPPSAAPTTARPSPTPSRTVRPAPAPSRTTAASRSQRSTAPRTTAPAVKGVSAQAQEVVDLANAERAKAGCAALKINDRLLTAAQRHSQDQADHREMSHDGSDGSDVGDRLDRVGYAWRAYGENVAWNQKTPAEVMDAWMNSPGHRANILNCSFTEIGVGVATSNGPYWTQDFGTPR